MTLHRTGAILKHYFILHQRQPHESKWLTVNQGPMRRVIWTYLNFAISSFISHLLFTNCRTPLLDLCYKLFPIQVKWNQTQKQTHISNNQYQSKHIPHFPTFSYDFNNFPMFSLEDHNCQKSPSTQSQTPEEGHLSSIPDWEGPALGTGSLNQHPMDMLRDPHRVHKPRQRNGCHRSWGSTESRGRRASGKGLLNARPPILGGFARM